MFLFTSLNKTSVSLSILQGVKCNRCDFCGYSQFFQYSCNISDVKVLFNFSTFSTLSALSLCKGFWEMPRSVPTGFNCFPAAFFIPFFASLRVCSSGAGFWWLPACAPGGGQSQKYVLICLCGFSVYSSVDASIIIDVCWGKTLD